MRPIHLELQGFASFRERTVIDLEGADLFVLSGPTGAGKSSVIDAVVFALYGSVPRLDDRRLVAPVITQGQLEARVRLTFEVGSRRYAATRVVRRTKSGATTKEARLERLAGDHAEVLAGTADELSTAIVALLGLTFEHFTRTVVLPQGAFQEFLHATPKDRQDLLVQLLDLDVYRRVAHASRDRAKAAEVTVTALERRLQDDLAGVTEQAVSEAEARVAALATLEQQVDDALDELATLEQEGRDARRSEEEARRRLALITSLQIPASVPALATRLRTARQHVARATELRDAATQARLAAEACVAEHPDLRDLRQLRDAVQAQQQAAAAIGPANERATESARSAERAQAAAQAADAAATAAVATLAALERRHLAHAVAADLEAGAPCPVCERTVETLPQRTAPADLDAAKDDAEQAKADVRRAEEVARRATSQAERDAEAAARAAKEAQALADAVSVQAKALDVDRDLETIQKRLASAEQAHAACQTAEADETRAAAILARAHESTERLRHDEDDAWREFGTARDTLAALSPPSFDRDADLGDAWRQLLDWAGEQRPSLSAAAEQATQAISAASDAYRTRLEQLRSAVAAAGLEVARHGAQEIGKIVIRALADARSDQQRLARDLRAAAEARTLLAEARERAAVAKDLGRHLNARNFENWLLNRALRRLVVGASDVLRDLTQGAYSLAVAEDGAFQVVDHRNADELRSARTLSGGETFLASLALALALAEHVAELAAQGSARLEALFLDEGFGTLDADTLDTVAAAIEELGSRGRMVGLITHVRDLAERMPVRFEVRRGTTTSTVEKVVL